MNFGVRYAFDSGRCSGPGNCSEAFARYGYVVGCNHAEEFPTQQWKGLVFYPGAVWYSLPGKCSSKAYWDHSGACELAEPGGFCDDVNGMGDCTYHYESAGEISIDELEGITDFKAFAAAGGWEYNNQTDHGVHMTFWDGKKDAAACESRLAHARELFKEKYPDSASEEEMPAPACNFNQAKFYAGMSQQF
jgi:hypothetical protein